MIRVRVEGFAELAQNLRALPGPSMRKALREALYSAAEPMRKRMGQLAPRGDAEPHLADNIVVSNAKGQDLQEAAVVVGPSKNVFYGSFQEFGTSRHGAQPFMRPAFESERDKVLDILKDATWRELAAKGINRPTRGGGSFRSGPGGSAA